MELKTKIDKAIWYCYTELYKASEPSADFEELVENAKIDENGRKVIDFMAYEITAFDMDVIIERTIGKFRIPKWQRGAFKTTIYLGCSPKTKQIDS